MGIILKKDERHFAHMMHAHSCPECKTLVGGPCDCSTPDIHPLCDQHADPPWLAAFREEVESDAS